MSTVRSIRSRAARSASVGVTTFGAPRLATAAPPVSTRGRPPAGTLNRSTGTMALLIFRTVGVLLDLSESLPTRMSPNRMRTCLGDFAFFGVMRRASQRRPCDLLRRKYGALATDAQRAFDADDGAAQAGTHGATHRLLHRDLQEG